MDMQDWGMVIVVIAVLIVNAPAMRRQWQTDRAGVIRTWWSAAVYVLYVVLGVWFFLGVMAPVGAQGPKVLFAIGLLFGWIFYGLLTLTRVVPRYRELPHWLTHFGVADIVLLAVIFGCAAAYLWSK
jgi:hypothetical protein